MLEPRNEREETYEYDELDDERRLEEVLAHALFAGGDFDVGPIADTIAIEGFNYSGDAGKGGEDAAGVEG